MILDLGIFFRLRFVVLVVWYGKINCYYVKYEIVCWNDYIDWLNICNNFKEVWKIDIKIIVICI